MSSQKPAAVIDFTKLEQRLAGVKNEADLYQQIVDAPFEQRVEVAVMFLGIVVLLRVNPKDGTVDRIALSNTEFAERTRNVSLIPFDKIKIPLHARHNIIVRAIETGAMQETTDWRSLFSPVLEAHDARINQASAGIAYSVVYPLRAGNGGALIYSYFQYRQYVNKLQFDFMQRYTKIADERMGQPSAST